MKLLLASGNAKKLAELSALLSPLGLEVLQPAQVGGIPSVDEDGATFAANAAKKAASAARHSGLWSLADDSGLEVDALAGAPGVHSARFAGRHGNDAANNRLLLERLWGLSPDRRGARFVCALALARPDGQIALAVEGTARGSIAAAPRGNRDFGYDPVFVFDEAGWPQSGRTFAELSAADKSRVSHRGRALRALLDGLPRIPHGVLSA